MSRSGRLVALVAWMAALHGCASNPGSSPPGGETADADGGPSGRRPDAGVETGPDAETQRTYLLGMMFNTPPYRNPDRSDWPVPVVFIMTMPAVLTPGNNRMTLQPLTTDGSVPIGELWVGDVQPRRQRVEAHFDAYCKRVETG